MGLDSFLWSDQLVFALGWSVLHSLWQGALIAGFTGIYLNGHPGMPAKKRYLWAFFGLMAILTSVILTFSWYLSCAAFGQISYRLDGDETSSAVLIVVKDAETRASLSVWFNRHLNLIVQGWIVGATLFGLRSLVGFGYARSMKRRGTSPAPDIINPMIRSLSFRMGIRQKVEVLESVLLHTPVVIGALKPVILLPLGLISRLSPEALEALLAHELAHVRRHDYLLNLLQIFVEILLYFNPAVWYLSAVVRREREYSCDDLAMHICGKPLVYAKALVAVQEFSQPGPGMAMALVRNKRALWVRIQRILQPTQNKSSYLMEKITMTGLILAMVFALHFQTAGGNSKPENQHFANASWQDIAFLSDSIPNGLSRVLLIENGERMEAEFENGILKQLRINDREVPATEFPAHEAKIAKMWKENMAAGKNESEKKSDTELKKITKLEVIQLNEGTESPSDLSQIFYMADSVLFLSDSTHRWTVKSRQADGVRTIVVDGSALFPNEDTTAVGTGKSLRFKASDLTYIKGMDTLRVKGMGSDGFLSEAAISEMLEGLNPERLAEVRVLRSGPDSRAIELIEIEGNTLGKRGNHEVKADLKLMESGTLNGVQLFQVPGSGKAGNALEQELLRDGLISDSENYTMELREGYLKVNGKKLPEGMARKYQKIYEQRTGMSLKNGGKVVIRK